MNTIKPKFTPRFTPRLNCKNCKHSVLDYDGTRLCTIFKTSYKTIDGTSFKRSVTADYARNNQQLCGTEAYHYKSRENNQDYLKLDEWY